MAGRKVAIMQPYALPYIGYFQLIRQADIFVYYNDANFIERGWINRNQFLVNREPRMLTVPLVKASSTKRINEVYVDHGNKQYKNLLNTIRQSYSKAPFFKVIFPMLENSMAIDESITIDKLAMRVNNTVCKYLGFDTEVVFSSEMKYSREAERQQKIIEMAQGLQASTILFPAGSRALYKSSDFIDYSTWCVVPDFVPYDQQLRTFFPALSIVDVLMFNSVQSVLTLLDNYQLAPLES